MVLRKINANLNKSLPGTKTYRAAKKKYSSTKKRIIRGYDKYQDRKLASLERKLAVVEKRERVIEARERLQAKKAKLKGRTTYGRIKKAVKKGHKTVGTAPIFNNDDFFSGRNFF